MKISCIQMDIQYGQPEENRKAAAKKIAEAAAEHPDVIVLPELWDTGYDLARLHTIADQDGKHTKPFIAALAKTFSVNIVAGSVAYAENGKVYNTTLVFNRHGEEISSYKKAHLIRLMDEEKYIAAGDSPAIFDLDGVLCGSLICYDIRFPEWVRIPVLQGAKLLFVPAQWPVQREAHWRTLLLARAIENQCYVIACNRIGADPNNTFAGQSMIIDPWGEIVAEAPKDTEMILHTKIDPQLSDEVRSRIPVFEDLRKNLYKKY